MSSDTAHAASDSALQGAAGTTVSPFAQRVAEYWREWERLDRERPGCLARQDLERFLPQWLASLDRDALSERRPWITFAAGEALEALLGSGARVFEWGAGGSTLFFGERVSELVTVEHDREWLQRTAALLPSRQSFRWRAHWIEPELRTMPSEYAETDPEAYASTDVRYAHMSFQNYARAIERYPHNYFDVVLIDGRARPACFKHAVAKVKFGGHIVVDNAERQAYAWIREAALRLGFDIHDYWGPGPYNRYFWCTSILHKVQKYFGLAELDKKLEPFVDFDGGTFVEAGANDGVSQNNTLYFEMYRGWRGLLIEPIYERVAECRRLRPHARVVHAALVEPEAAGKPALLHYANLMSVIKGGMRSLEEEEAHIKAGCAVQSIETHEFVAPGATLSDLLDQHGLVHVDVLSLDVEGYEAKALKGLDLQRHQPRFILVEARYREEVTEVLSDHYVLVAELSHHDLLYRLKNDPGPRKVEAEAESRRVGAAPNCIACESAMSAHHDGMFDDRYGYPGYFSLYRCRQCGQLQTVPLLEEADLPALYGTYYPRKQTDVATLVQQVGDPWSREAQRHRWWSGTDNQGQYQAQPGMVVLDYGCGSGQSLLELKRLGVEAYGIEADPNVRELAAALDLRIHIGNIDDHPFPGLSFDLIILNQVLEHIPHPAHTLAKLADRLKPRGRMVLSFPNSASVYCHWFDRDWINWHIPYHLHHFNPRSAREFFAAHGFRVVALRTITPNLWTVLQLRAVRERTRMGVPNGLWTGQPAPGSAVSSKRESSSKNILNLVFYPIALRANERWARGVLTAFNRLCDAAGRGDSILVVVERGGRP